MASLAFPAQMVWMVLPVCLALLAPLLLLLLLSRDQKVTRVIQGPPELLALLVRLGRLALWETLEQQE